MPTAMTFDSLTADLKAYLERGFPADGGVVAQIPRLINLAERAIARELKVLGFIESVFGSLQANVNIYQKPDRWRRTVSMRYGVAAPGSGFQNVSTPIFTRSYEYCRVYAPDQTITGPPEFYADYNYTHWLVAPTPDINYPWEIMYSQQPPLLDSTNQSNWLTDYAPNALLYRSLLEATPFLKNDERIPTWQAFFEKEVNNLGMENLEQVLDRSIDREEA